MKPTNSRWRSILFGVGLLYMLRAQIIRCHLWFEPKAAVGHLESLVRREHLALRGKYVEERLDRNLAEWELTGPIKLALPPMYADSAFGNAGFLTSFVNHGAVRLYNGPFPHPKLEINEHLEGAPMQTQPYAFDNRSSNAALYTAINSYNWPLGYSAWYDMVMSRRKVWVAVPRVIDQEGTLVSASAVRAVHPLNAAALNQNTTAIELRHLSPIVWTFPGEVHLEHADPGFAAEAISDGLEVSWMPTLPPVSEQPLGLFLLAPLLAAKADGAVPSWWSLDERFRRAVVDDKPVELRRALLRDLTDLFPTHPFLPHYRVIAELGSDRFDEIWVKAQSATCMASTWYLVAWTHLPYSRVRLLPCLNKLGDDTVDEPRAYIAEWAVIAFRAERKNPELQNLAQRVVQAGYLKSEFRGFNYPPNDFAWLWLRTRP